MRSSSIKKILGNLATKRKFREELGKERKYNGDKCVGLASFDFLKGESCKVKGKRYFPSVAQHRLKTDSKLKPSARVAGKKRTRKGRRARKIAVRKPIEELRQFLRRRK